MKRGPLALHALIALSATVILSTSAARAERGATQPLAPGPLVPSASSSVSIAPGTIGLTGAAFHRADEATQARANEWMSRANSGWIPNHGQIGTSASGPASSVLFSGSIRDAKVFVTRSGLSHYFLSRIHDDADELKAGNSTEREAAPELVQWCRLDLDLKGADIRPEHARLEDPLLDQGGTNYYLPQCPDGVLNVPTYGKLTFPDVYPGIDWVVLSRPGESVQHDFIVHPGADASLIRMEYEGASSIDLSDDQRALIIRTPLGELREGALNCTQPGARTPIGARFHVEGNAVSLKLDAYDTHAPLTIDPPLVWSTYYGGTGNDGPRSMICDNANNNVYVVGYSNSNDMPVKDTLGGSYFQGTLAGGFLDAFIWKFSQTGVRAWATYYGGAGVEVNTDCALDPSGNLYVSGQTSSPDFPTQALAGAYNQPGLAGDGDAYFLKFDPAGVRLWATYYGGSGSDLATGIATDASGRVFACGATGSNDLVLANPGGGAYFQNTLLANQDAFVLRFGSTGALEWATYFGGANGNDAAWGIATSASDVFVTGSAESPTFPVLNSPGAYFQGTMAGLQDAFISRFSLGGVQQWTTYYGGSGMDSGDEPVVDASGNLFVCGFTLSSNLPTLNPGGTAYYQGALGGLDDLFLLKFNSVNATTWATYLGGTGSDSFNDGFGKHMVLNAQGRIYITAKTLFGGWPVLNPGGGSFFQGTPAGDYDATFVEFANNGTMLWSTYFGTVPYDFGTGISVGNDGCVFGTGETFENGNLPIANPGGGSWNQTSDAGGDDGYLVRFCPPNLACCVDNSCVSVASASQCTSLGGTFYPNQPCTPGLCNVLCSICGKKFNDLNRNGVQDTGELGLAGWTILLLYPNGTLYAGVTTDSNGNYCFSNIPCGAWKVSEVMLPYWVQTYPSPATHSFTLPTATTQNGVNFGNFGCNTVTCLYPPTSLVASWPFTELPGSTSASDAAHVSPPRNVAQLFGGASGGTTSLPGALCLNAASDYARVPNAGQLGLQFANGSFAIAAWINSTSTTSGPRMIVEKRILLSASTHETRGWALYLNGLQSFLELGTGSTPQIVMGPTLAADSWEHLAVSLDRANGVGRWYLDGNAIAALDFVPNAGLVSSNADLYIGRVSPPFGTSAAFQGCISDLAMFSAPLGSAAVSKAWTGGPIAWCPEFAVLPQVTTYCKSQATAQVCFNIGNNYATPQTYHWSLAGLPAGPGCTVAGPLLFNPMSGTITVPPGLSGPVCVTIPRPAGLTAQNATACYALTFINDATGACRTKTATLRADNSCWCVTPIPVGALPVPAFVASGGIIGIGIRHPCDPPTSLAYQLRAVWLDPDHEDPLALSLNGLPPGTPVTGSVTAGPSADEQIAVSASFPKGYDATARYEIILVADTDGDGLFENLSGTVVVPAYDGTELTSAPTPATPEQIVQLVTNPNPFVGGTTIGFTLARPEPIELGVYDLGGRLVRSLHHGQIVAGTHRLDWNGRDDNAQRVAAGVYFVRFDGAEHHLEAKLVKIQ